MTGRFGIACAIIAAVVLSVAVWPLAQAQEETPGRKLAFLVGVNRYRHAKLDKLDFAECDVEELAKVLGRHGYRVALIKGREAQIDQIQAKLKDLLKTAGSQDLILVALAGHGLQPSGSSDAFFCPYDANPTIEERQGSSPNQITFPQTLLSINGKKGLIAKLDETGIGQTLLMVDACRNYTSSGRGRGVAIEFRDGRAFASVSSEGQTVFLRFRRRDAEDKTCYSVVLRVNGENTLYRQRKKDLDCNKWILEPGEQPLAIEGFQLNDKQVQQFKVLSKAASKAREIDYGADVETISMTVFRQRNTQTSPTPAPDLLSDAAEDFVVLNRGVRRHHHRHRIGLELYGPTDERLLCQSGGGSVEGRGAAERTPRIANDV